MVHSVHDCILYPWQLCFLSPVHSLAGLLGLFLLPRCFYPMWSAQPAFSLQPVPGEPIGPHCIYWEDLVDAPGWTSDWEAMPVGMELYTSLRLPPPFHLRRDYLVSQCLVITGIRLRLQICHTNQHFHWHCVKLIVTQWLQQNLFRFCPALLGSHSIWICTSSAFSGAEIIPTKRTLVNHHISRSIAVLSKA